MFEEPLKSFPAVIRSNLEAGGAATENNVTKTCVEKINFVTNICCAAEP